ncbi:hypothetical protein C7447_102115 [Tenacibaculum adriaticum]|uniref:Uncharacterized protein n=1 Tax=Tenacibaculum adriaticum TaxID=413713 RepID=A0A5S5DS91_9FLAO|nr:hypothetical protein [Tenacibaculum adriaticum]TYP98800.1 hypothetical protein C7447_102115 [Tenacibaculum adriaticum]
MILLIFFNEPQIDSNSFLLSLFGGALGGGIFSLIAIILNNYFEKNKYEKEIKTFLWKEKIQASKKASEFYLEIINYFNLAIANLELILDEEIGYSSLSEKIAFHENRINSINSFEHHHVNIFYDLVSEEAKNQSIKLNKAIHKIKLLNIDDDRDKIIFLITDIRDCYSSLENIYIDQLSNVRSNIKSYIE